LLKHCQRFDRDTWLEYDDDQADAGHFGHRQFDLHPDDVRCGRAPFRDGWSFDRAAKGKHHRVESESDACIVGRVGAANGFLRATWYPTSPSDFNRGIPSSTGRSVTLVRSPNASDGLIDRTSGTVTIARR
jgi:hypothetical protein